MTDRTHNVSTKTKKLIGLGATSIKILGAPIILCWRSPGHSKSIHLHGGQKTIDTHFQPGIKQLSKTTAITTHCVMIMLLLCSLLSLMTSYQSHWCSDLQRWHWVCSWRAQAIAPPPPPIFPLHDWYNCNLYFESMIINIKWVCGSNILWFC